MTRRQEAEAGSSGQGNAVLRDRFDNVSRSGRVGAHRIVAKPRRFWLYFFSALIGIALVTGAGIIAVQITGANVSGLWTTEEDRPAVPATPSVDPVIDPAAEVVVLNGTSMPGFGAIVDSLISQNQWGTILFSTDAAANDVEISAVFYASPDDEAAALGLARELGGVSIYQNEEYSQEYGARLVVLLGSDYAGPGSDQLVLADPAAPAEGGAGDEVAEEEAAE